MKWDWKVIAAIVVAFALGYWIHSSGTARRVHGAVTGAGSASAGYGS